MTNNMKLIDQYNLTKYDKGVTNMSDRQKPVNWLAQYVGIKEGSAEHKAILKVFNDSGLCTRYKMTVNDALHLPLSLQLDFPTSSLAWSVPVRT